MSFEPKTIRICFVSPKVYPLFNPEKEEVFGGAEVDLYYLATELAKDPAFDISFVTADYGQPRTETIENVRLIRSFSFKQFPPHAAWAVWKALARAHADIYIIKTTSPGVPLLNLFCRIHKKHFIYRTSSHYDCDGTYVKSHKIIGRLFARSLRRARLVFTQSQMGRSNLKKTLGVHSIVIPNGHRIPPLQSQEKNSILWVGRSAQVKQPYTFLDLARQFPQQSFVMICQRATGDDNYHQLLRQAKDIPNLEFLPRVPFDQVGRYFQAARIFVNTSTAEGFPNTFIQACSAATCILSLNVNPDDFLNEHSCGLCCYGHIDNLSQAMSFLLERNHYIELGRNARRYVEQKHDIREIVKLYKEIFLEITQENK